MGKLIEYIKKYRERVVLTGVALSFLLFIGGGIFLQNLNSRKSDEEKALELPEQVELEVQKVSDGKDGAAHSSSSTSSSFLLQPSAETLVQQLQEMQNLRPDVAQKKLQTLRVLWPVYFFEIKESEQQRLASFDISSDGFGVVVRAAYSPERFPELDGIAPGRKLWVGGEITMVDLSGTGSVELKLEYVDFSDGIPGVAESTASAGEDR